jgi:hypothetical protein
MNPPEELGEWLGEKKIIIMGKNNPSGEMLHTRAFSFIRSALHLKPSPQCKSLYFKIHSMSIPQMPLMWIARKNRLFITQKFIRVAQVVHELRSGNEQNRQMPVCPRQQFRTMFFEMHVFLYTCAVVSGKVFSEGHIIIREKVKFLANSSGIGTFF